MNEVIFYVLGSYIVGSIPFGKLLGLSLGKDLQKEGSGNIGFANAWRVLGLKYGVLVLILDMAKGFVPTFIALKTFPLSQALMVAGVVIIGHIFPIWLKLKGGKGVATYLGASFAINPILGLIGIGTWALLFSVFKIASSLSQSFGSSELSISTRHDMSGVNSAELKSG